MEKKKTNNAHDIIGAYMKQILEHGERPKSIYAFAQKIKMKESEIYDHFGSFEAIEKSIFKAFFDNTKVLLDKNKEYQTFDAKNKLKALINLSSLKKAFQEYIEELEIETINLKEEKIEKLKNRSVAELTWAQLLFTIKFWMEDGSPGFEKTDVLIEKSITTGFALIDNAALNSVFDLGKFLFKEKMTTN